MLKRLFKFSIYLYVLVLSVFSLAGCNVTEKLAPESSASSNEIYDTPSSENAISSESVASSDKTEVADTSSNNKIYSFRTDDFFTSHYEKHGGEFGSITRQQYLAKANELISSKTALTKTEEDGDLLYYDAEKNEFLVLSTDGYIRTFFKPDDGMDYFERQ